LYGGGLVEIKPDGSYEQYTVASTGGDMPQDTLTHMEIKDNVLWASTLSEGIIRMPKLINEGFVPVVDRRIAVDVPDQIQLYNNYPNPFNPATTINFDLKKRTDVNLSIYNVRGEFVRNIVSGTYDSGHYSVQWDGTDFQGSGMSSGVYIYKLTAGDVIYSRKMTLIK